MTLATTLRCPACRAENSTGPLCRRCKADLSLLWQLEEQRAVLLARAVTALQRGDWNGAHLLATHADDLRRGEDAERLRVLAQLFQGDFVGAWSGAQRISG